MNTKITKFINNKNYAIMKKSNIEFIVVNEGKLTQFTSALHKGMFLDTHKEGTYKLTDNGNAVVEDLYMIIDTERTGFCLTPEKAVTYNEALDIIKHYL